MSPKDPNWTNSWDITEKTFVVPTSSTLESKSFPILNKFKGAEVKLLIVTVNTSPLFEALIFESDGATLYLGWPLFITSDKTSANSDEVGPEEK